MEVYKILLPLVFVLLNLCLSGSIRLIPTSRRVNLLRSSNPRGLGVSREGSFSINQNNCQCFEAPINGNNAVYNLGFDGDSAIRTVIYAYRESPFSQNIRLYIPNIERQVLFPELPFKNGDATKKLNTNNEIYSFIYNNNHNAIVVNDSSPFNEEVEITDNLHIDIPDSYETDIITEITDPTDIEAAPNVQIENQNELPNSDDIENINEIPIEIANQPESPYSIDSVIVNPNNEMFEPNSEIDYSNGEEISPDYGTIDSEQTIHDQSVETLPNQSEHNIWDSQEDSQLLINQPIQSLPLQPGEYTNGQTDIALPEQQIDDQSSQQTEQLINDQSEYEIVSKPERPTNLPAEQYQPGGQTEYNLPEQQTLPQVPVSLNEEDFYQHEGQGQFDVTFDTWVAKQLKNVALQGPVIEDEIDFAVLKLIIQKTLRKNGISVNTDGLLTDSQGVAIDMANLHLRPMLIGNTVPYQKVVNGESFEIIKKEPYLEVLMITLADPPRTLGFIPLGLTYVPVPPKVVKHVSSNHVSSLMTSTGRAGIFSKQRASKGIIRRSPPSTKQNQWRLLKQGLTNQIEGFPSSLRNRGKKSMTLRKSKSNKTPLLESRAAEDTVDSELLKKLFLRINPLQYIYDFLGRSGSSKLVEPTRQVKYRIIGGNSALNSGPLVNIKGRSGRVK